MSPIKQPTKLPKTAIEILKVLYVDENNPNSIEIADIFKRRGIEIDSRTVRYHLKQLKNIKLVKNIGRKGWSLTEEGNRYIRKLMVYERLGNPTPTFNNLVFGCSFNLERFEGDVPSNVVFIPKERFEEALSILESVSKLKIFPSHLLAISDEGEKLGGLTVPNNYIGIGCISSAIYDVVFLKNGIYIEPLATGIYEIIGGQPVCFVELITHAGSTISPGELLIKSGHTSVSSIVETGSGYVTAAIRRFPSIFYEVAEKITKKMLHAGIEGVIEYIDQVPDYERIDLSDVSKSRIVVYGGGNYFAPLVEKNLVKEIHINATLIDVSEMKTPLSLK